jgi:hypothetical protein
MRRFYKILFEQLTKLNSGLSLKRVYLGLYRMSLCIQKLEA